MKGVSEDSLDRSHCRVLSEKRDLLAHDFVSKDSDENILQAICWQTRAKRMLMLAVVMAVEKNLGVGKWIAKPIGAALVALATFVAL